MNILIHDLEKLNEKTLKQEKENIKIISDNGKITPCICCFGCWIKTPGKCVLNDGYDNIGSLFSECEQLVIISKCCYGSYSPFVHNVLDRSVPSLLPYFMTINGETHHQCRYHNNFILKVYFYGIISDKEKETAIKLVKANGINHFAQKTEVYFFENAQDIQVVL
jgi:multimeric flavodoxin WrbA